jgi:hypothetical protein
VSAPDCIQPLFEGASHWALRRAVRQKLAFLRETGGLYVGIVHAGVFGPRDADRREAHLRFVARQAAVPASGSRASGDRRLVACARAASRSPWTATASS